MKEKYKHILEIIASFQNGEINFHEYRQYMEGLYIGYELDYEGDEWSDDLDNWLELIEYTYPEKDWYELGCSLGNFIQNAIENEPCPLKLPENDRVIRDHFIKRHTLLVYFDQPANLIGNRIAEVMKKHDEIFSEDYHINPVLGLDQIGKYHWEDFGEGFEAVSVFSLRELRPTTDTKINEMISLLKTEFSDLKIGILMDEYTLV